MPDSSEGVLLDTGIALRLYDRSDASHSLVTATVEALLARGTILFVSPQVIYELRSVLTRPLLENGKGRSAEQFGQIVAQITRIAQLKPDPDDMVARWMSFCEKHGVVGKRSHDARLVAWMEAYGVDTILTLNPRDFRTFASIAVLTPEAPGTL